eukprot:tig00000093_g3543.t1
MSLRPPVRLVRVLAGALLIVVCALLAFDVLGRASTSWMAPPAVFSADGLPANASEILNELSDKTGAMRLYLRRVAAKTLRQASFWMIVAEPALDQFVSASIFNGGEWDPAVEHLFLAAAAPRCASGDAPLFVDVGSHVGYFSLHAAAAGCRVLALEPQTALWSLLAASARLNGFPALSARNAAASDASGRSVRIQAAPDANMGGARVSEEGADAQGVSTVTLDELLGGADGPKIAMLKADCEGYETRAFAGGRRLFESGRVQTVVFEIQPRALGGLPQTLELMGQLRAWRYALYEMNRLATEAAPGAFGGRRVAAGALEAALLAGPAADEDLARRGHCTTDVFAVLEGVAVAS